MPKSELIRQIEAAITGHERWKDDLVAATRSGRPATAGNGSEAGDPAQWLQTIACEPGSRDQAAAQEIRHLHREFHRVAGSVKAYLARGMASAAQFIMDGECAALSEMLLEALCEWRDACLQDQSSASAISLRVFSTP